MNRPAAPAIRAASPPRAWASGLWSAPPLAAALLVAVMLHVVVLALPALLPLAHAGQSIADPWAHWDAVYFVRLATQGYAPYVHGVDHTGLAFLPLYPLLLNLPIRLGLPPYVAAIVSSNVCALLALALLGRVVARDCGPRIAARAVVLLSVAPAALFLSLGYSESLFLVLSLGAFLLLRRRRWTGAALLCGLAAVTRPTGDLLVLAYVAEWLQVYGRTPRAGLRQAAILALAAVPLLVVAVYDVSIGAAPLAYLGVEHTVWHHTLAWPWVTLWGQGRALAPLGAAGSSLLPAGVMGLAAAVVAIPLLIVTARRLPLSYAVYALAVYAMTVGVSSDAPFYGHDVTHPFVLPLGSAHRYLLMAFPLAVAAGMVLRRRLFVVTALVLALLQLGLAVLFMLRLWAG